MEQSPGEDTLKSIEGKSEATTSSPSIAKSVRKKEMLSAQIEGLTIKIEQTQMELNEAHGQLGQVDPNARVQRHIKLLHDYNEIKDIGMGLFGMIAERRGVRVKEVFAEFGIGDED